MQNITSTQKLRVLVIGDSTSCTMLPGLEAVAPSYGVQIGNGAIIGCGVVSGQVEPVYYDGLNVAAFTKSCQRRANHVESNSHSPREAKRDPLGKHQKEVYSRSSSTPPRGRRYF